MSRIEAQVSGGVPSRRPRAERDPWSQPTEHSAVRAQYLPELAPRYAVAWRGVVEADALSPKLGALMLHRMVFGFPDGELMRSIPMPAPRGEEKRACHFVWFRPVAASALAGLCTDACGKVHGVSIPPPLIRPELIAVLQQDAGRAARATACNARERHGADHPAADLRA